MADTSRAFITRVISGLVALFLLAAVAYYGHQRGLILICTIMILLGVREFSRMAFRHWPMPARLTPIYALICILTFVVLFTHTNHTGLAFALGSALFTVSTLWNARGKVTNENLLAALGMGNFGLIYCVLFPFYSIRLVQLPEGGQWFLLLLLVVFFGDTFAYFSGRWFGKRKFMPLVSPNKTWAGSVGGLIGSAVAGTIHVATAFEGISLWQTALFCLVCGAAAQSGDLVMSLVKRVAQVKDSGTIMPGHGGVLDRLDGIFVGAPLVYAYALYCIEPLSQIVG